MVESSVHSVLVLVLGAVDPKSAPPSGRKSSQIYHQMLETKHAVGRRCTDLQIDMILDFVPSLDVVSLLTYYE